MKTHRNVDVIAFLSNVVVHTVTAYRSDWEADIERIRHAVKSADPEDRHLLWMARPTGTWCVSECRAYRDGSDAHSIWTYYEDTPEIITAYALELTGAQGNKILGNLYQLDYPQHVQQIHSMELSKYDCSPEQEAELKSRLNMLRKERQKQSRQHRKSKRTLER